MRKITVPIMLSLAVSAANATCAAAGVQGLPPWLSEVESSVSRAFLTTASVSLANRYDHVNVREYAVFRLQGRGRLRQVPDPFEAMRISFPLARGWKEDLRYAADGHGSSSIAYRKDAYFCVASVGIDSSCDDWQTGHVAAEFWFSVDCRESGHGGGKD